MTDAERKLWWNLRALLAKEFHFRRQATIGPYFVDFACHQKRIVVEVDGSRHMTRVRSDVARTAFLNSRGYRVLGFWNNEVLQQTDAVMAAIYDALCEDRGSAPTLTPPRRSPRSRGEGNRLSLRLGPCSPRGSEQAQLAARPFNPEAGREL
jgi:very-short-patch-repair endonuclease